MDKIFNKIKGGLVVSCQGLEDEPMHGSSVMAKFAKAAYMGGAVGIRANTASDIKAIKKAVKLPIIGIIKKEYPDSEVYITPTMKEVDALVKSGANIIAIDATNRIRPNKIDLKHFVQKIRSKYKNIILFGDISNYEEAVTAEKLGFDCVGTTLRSYTSYTKGVKIPDLKFIKKISSSLKIPVIAEGGISSPAQLASCLKAGAFAAVVGGAITRPQNITKSFVKAITK